MYRLESFWHDSVALADNPLGDPTHRQTWVLTPEGHDADVPLPAIWMLASFLSTGSAFLSFRPWQENLWDRVNRLQATGMLPPVRFVLPDVFTRLGGSQYLDSPAIGAYQTYLWQELLPAMEDRYATRNRGLAGTSSGGYGAIVSALLGPTLFSGLVAHAADMGFSWGYLPDYPKFLEVIRRFGGVEAFWQTFLASPSKPQEWLTAVNLLAMAAAYSPNMDALPPHVDLPLDPVTLEPRTEIWSRWQQWDPIEFISTPAVSDRARELRLFYFDAGDNDQYNLQYGAQKFHLKLCALGIPHAFEIFSGGHFGTQTRFDQSLPRLAKALSD